SDAPAVRIERIRAVSPLRRLMSALQDEFHGGGEAFPFVHLVAECATSLPCDGVVPRATVVLGVLPIALDVAAKLEALERWIERALIDVEASARDLSDAEADPPAVHRLERECLEDQQVDATPEDVGFGGMSCRHGSSLEDESSIQQVS